MKIELIVKNYDTDVIHLDEILTLKELKRYLTRDILFKDTHIETYRDDNLIHFLEFHNSHFLDEIIITFNKEDEEDLAKALSYIFYRITNDIQKTLEGSK